MNAWRDDEAKTAGLLQAASAEYDDLPTDVAGRLDRVLEQLPSADTLHSGEEPAAVSLTERLRPKRRRYALVSAAAALIVTVGGVALAVQVVSEAGGGDSATMADQEAAGSPQDEDLGAASEAEEFNAEEEPQEVGPGDGESTMDVETFATGTDYDETADLLSALRQLGGESTGSAVPEELAALADGGELWQNCQNALARRYDGLVVAADFARFETEPAVMALLVSDSGEIAVAVAPDCAHGIIDELFSQR
ncbi:hypothetical protein [Glycomyces tarimensis]